MQMQNRCDYHLRPGQHENVSQKPQKFPNHGSSARRQRQMAEKRSEFETLAAAAKGGCNKSLGMILQKYHAHLTLMASTSLANRFHSKLSPSDLVQETYRNAHRDIANFRGTSENELLGWLRTILANQLVKEIRFLSAQRRDIRREKQLTIAFDEASPLVRPRQSRPVSPSSIARRKEGHELLQSAISKLPPDHARIIELRHLHGLPFEQIANRTDRTINSVKSIWRRAICALKSALQED